MLTFQLKETEREVLGYEKKFEPQSFSLEISALPGDHLIGDLIVSGLRDDISSDQISLFMIGTTINDFLRVSLTDSRQSNQLGL